MLRVGAGICLRNLYTSKSGSPGAKRWGQLCIRRHLSSQSAGSGTAESAPISARWLGGLGAVPFAFCAASTVVGSDVEPYARYTQLYGACILSFLGGVHWGVALRTLATSSAAHRMRHVDYVYSVLPSLIASGSAFLAPAEGLAILVPAFISAWVYDNIRFRQRADVPTWYLRLRTPLTVAAVASTSIALGALSRAQKLKDQNQTEQQDDRVDAKLPQQEAIEES